MRVREPAEADAKLQCVNAGIRRHQSCVGNVHEADFCAPVVFAAQKMSTDRTAGGEVHVRGPGRNFVVAEKRTAADVDVGHDVMTRDEIPFQREGIETDAIRSSRSLQNEKYRHDVQ